MNPLTANVYKNLLIQKFPLHGKYTVQYTMNKLHNMHAILALALLEKITGKDDEIYQKFKKSTLTLVGSLKRQLSRPSSYPSFRSLTLQLDHSTGGGRLQNAHIVV